MDWMTTLPGEMKLKNVVLPGAHDAATALSTAFSANSDALRFYCQNESVYGLLSAGVRYLDLRVGRNGDDGLYTYHEVFFTRFSDVVADINRFALETEDFFILDFQHFSGDCENDALKEMMKVIDFQRYAITTDYDPSNMTLSEIRASKKRFMVIWNRDTCVAPKYLFPRNDSLFSPYDEEYHINGTLAEHLDAYVDAYDGDGLFVLQAQLSFADNTPSPRGLENIFAEKCDKYLENISVKRLKKLNIVMRDFVTEDDKINKIINMNKRKVGGKMGIKGFHHVAINAVDFDKSEKFYTEILGLKKVNAWGGDNSRCAMFAAEDGARIELFESKEHIDEPKSPIVHFAFNVDFPDPFIEAVRAAGYEVTVEPKDVDVATPMGFKARIAFCKGPDGEIIEFFAMKE